jgi:hypothetical protein
VTPSVLAAQAAGVSEDDGFIVTHVRHTVDLLMDRSQELADGVAFRAHCGCRPDLPLGRGQCADSRLPGARPVAGGDRRSRARIDIRRSMTRTPPPAEPDLGTVRRISSGCTPRRLGSGHGIDGG